MIIVDGIDVFSVYTQSIHVELMLSSLDGGAHTEPHAQ